MARSTKEQAQETRSRILDAAERVFERQGVSGTSLSEVAQAAGVTRGAIYWHFRDKVDLFNAMMERVTLPLEQACSACGSSGARGAGSAKGARSAKGPKSVPDELARLRESFVDVLRRIVGDAQLQRVFGIAIHKVEYAGELEALRARHAGLRDAYVADIERTLRGAMRRGELPRRAGARAAALGLHALFDGLLQNWMLVPRGFDLVRVGTQVFDAYLAGLAAPARGEGTGADAGIAVDAGIAAVLPRARRAPAPRRGYIAARSAAALPDQALTPKRAGRTR
jgi:TetR/AcrR family acrAB operon transcriptional repressor